MQDILQVLASNSRRIVFATSALFAVHILFSTQHIFYPSHRIKEEFLDIYMVNTSLNEEVIHTGVTLYINKAVADSIDRIDALNAIDLKRYYTQSYPVNFLVDCRVESNWTTFDRLTTSNSVSWKSYFPGEYKHNVEFNLRISNLILYFGIVIGILIVLMFLPQLAEKSVPLAPPISSRTSNTETPNPDNSNLDNSDLDNSAPGTGDPAKISEVESILRSEVGKAQNEAENLSARSTLMLLSGIVMAFVGILVFAYSLPPFPDEGLDAIKALSLSWRSTGMLIFIESIAWFLLRQYRALFEDYKAFNRGYLKRANYLVAYKLVEESNNKDAAEIYMLINLIQEDLSGRLGAGETTEALEGQKIIDPSPIPDILKVVFNRENSTKENGPKDKAK